MVEQLGERYRYHSEADTASSWGDRERRVVTRLVVCRREGVERMVVRWAGVKSSTSFSTTDVD